MTSSSESPTGVPSVGPGTDVTADPDALDAHDDGDKPATSDPAEYDGGEELGGTGGENAGGAG